MRQKRFLSWLLTLCLLLGMFSFPAYAEGNTTTNITQNNTSGTMTITLVIPKKTPAATDLTYTAPSDLTYSGSNKAATVAVASGVTGLGTITVKYYSDASRTTEATPKNVGTYYVGATVAEGDQYAASTAVLYGDGWTFTITASTPSAPAAPTKASATKNSITLNAVSGCEYSKDGANWQSGTEFTGLNPGTEYTVYQRIKATSNTNASDASSAKFSTEADTYAMTITLMIIDKDPATVTKAPTAKTLTYNGQAQVLVTAGEASGGTMQYALGTATEATEPYTTSIPTATNAGTYYVWYRVKGDLNHYDSEPRCVTVNIANALYTVTSVENWEHTINYPNDIIITVKRNAADNITYSMYTGASVDGNGIPAGGSSVAQGSLILTLKGSYLDTLSTGTHKVTISFKDGSADATISIVNAPPAPTAAPTHVPKTGDGANLGLWIGLILLGFLGIIAFAGMAGRKHRNR